MDKDKSPALGGGGGGNLPPHSSRFAAAFGSPSSSFVAMGDPTPSSSSSQDAGRFSHDISQMPDVPPRNTGHRRAHSEILSLPDDLTFDSDLGVVGSHDGPSLSDDTEEDLFSMFIDIDKWNSCATSGLPGAEPSGTAGAASSSAPLPPLSPSENSAPALSERPRIRHQHSQSMDGSTSIKAEMLASGGEGPSGVETKKAISAAKLADLALVDPKRAKRIWANRQSAARSKERKMRYIAELERKVQTLQTEATTLSAQLTMLQRDTTGLTAENSELKLRLQTMEQQVHLQDALNDALREEVQRLKLATGQGQMMQNGGPIMNFGPPSFGVNQLYHHNQAMQSLLAAQQLQQLQIRQPQQQVHPHQPQQQQQQPPSVDMRMKGPMTSQNQRGESRSDNSSSHHE